MTFVCFPFDITELVGKCLTSKDHICAVHYINIQKQFVSLYLHL